MNNNVSAPTQFCFGKFIDISGEPHLCVETASDFGFHEKNEAKEAMLKKGAIGRLLNINNSFERYDYYATRLAVTPLGRRSFQILIAGENNTLNWISIVRQNYRSIIR